MTSSRPIVSVLMPAYNHRAFIGEAVASVLTQTHQDLELIIIDDGSTDGTEALLADLQDPRLRLERQSNRGSSAALNRAMALARGDYLAIINSDDRFHPERLERLLAIALAMADRDDMAEHAQHACFLVTGFRLIDGDGVPIVDAAHPWRQRIDPILRRAEQQPPLAALLYGNFTVSTSNFFFSRALAERVGRFQRYRYVQDWDYALRAAFAAPEGFRYLPEPLFDYRLHAANTIADPDGGIRCDSEIIRMYARVLGTQKPDWREALTRQRSFALDIRRSLSARALANAREADHAFATVAEQSRVMREQEAHHRELAAELAHRHREILQLHKGYRVELERVASEIQQLHTDYQAQLRAAHDALDHKQVELDHAQTQINLIYSSLSWRLTRPLRQAADLARAARARLLRGLTPLWHRLPLRPDQRFRLKGAAFNRFPRLFQASAAYQAWQGQQAAAPPAEVMVHQRLEGLVDATATAGKLRIPGGVAPEPRVSVIIPVYNKLHYTLRCLDAIATHPPADPIEVIVVDDGSSDDTQAQLSQRDDLRYLRNPENLGFVGSCNHGAEVARGELLFFLNNDTAVLAGWLDHLVQTFARIPEAGLVGSKLIYPDGRLQEAGGIIWQDGSGWNWGRLGDPAAPEYNFLRDVDYCSGAAIAIPRALFAEFGGFSQTYAPAYYEDTDLAFRVRAAGRRVLYQPLSWVVHDEGITAGTDTGSGVKAYQARNRERFLATWREQLADHGSPESQPPARAADRRPRARLLIIDACTPTPDQDSGSIDMVNYLTLFDQLGYRVSFIPESNRLHFGRYTEALQARGVECLYHPYLSSVADLLERRGAEFDAVMLVRGPLAFHYLDLVRTHCPQAKVIVNTVDLHFLRERRRAELETGQPDSAIARAAYREETHVIRHADASIVISPVEQDLLARELPEARVRVIPLIREVPGRQAGFAEREGLLFVGGFQHPPNVDAMQWFCAEVWPLVRAQLPGVQLQIVGSNMVPEIDALAADDIQVLGFVEDLVPLLERARLSIAPLRYGAGQKGKVIGSLSHGLPCVATTVAAEGLGLGPEEGVLVADSPAEFAAAIERAYTDAALWEQLSSTGLERVEAEFSLAANRRRLAALLAELGLPTEPALPAEPVLPAEPAPLAQPAPLGRACSAADPRLHAPS